jgi:hypothetical protein
MESQLSKKLTVGAFVASALFVSSAAMAVSQSETINGTASIVPAASFTCTESSVDLGKIRLLPGRSGDTVIAFNSDTTVAADANTDKVFLAGTAKKASCSAVVAESDVALAALTGGTTVGGTSTKSVSWAKADGGPSLDGEFKLTSSATALNEVSNGDTLSVEANISIPASFDAQAEEGVYLASVTLTIAD